MQGIWQLPLAGGDEVRISEAGAQGRWALSARGLYFLKAPDELAFLDFSTMLAIPIPTPGLRLGNGTGGGMLGVAPGDRWILVTAPPLNQNVQKTL